MGIVVGDWHVDLFLCLSFLHDMHHTWLARVSSNSGTCVQPQHGTVLADNCGNRSRSCVGALIDL